MTMNKFNILFAALAAGILFFSCDKPEPEPGPDGPVDPVVPEVVVTFPDVVENFEVKPGDTLSLSFTPAKDWSVSVPSENIQWFWIADGSFKVDKLSGTASEEAVTVKIGVSETEEFDTNRSCDVTLTIGDESKVIAQYMRPAKERTLAVYAAEGTEEIETVNIEWSAENADFRTLLRVESNYDWTVSYPDWLKVNVPEKTSGVVELMLTGQSLEDVSGKLEFKAGESTVKEITVNLPSCKGMDIYSAQVEDGEFKYADEGDYLWTEGVVEEINLAWLGSDFRMPVKISSKCEWTAELPEWLTFEMPEKTAGEVTITLLGVPSKYPLEDASGKIVFKYEETVIHEVNVTIPGCKDIMSYSLGMALTSLDFNAAGEVMTSTGYADVDVTASVFGTSKVEVFVFEKVAGKYLLDETPEWVTVNVSAFNTASDASVLQEREVKISVSENKSGDREAVLFVAPHSLSGNVKAAFTDDRTALKEEYQQYAVSISQLSSKFVITMNSSSEAMAEAGASFVEASAEKKAELSAAFGDTDQIYVLTYSNVYALDEAYMSMTRSFTSVKVYDADKADKSAVEDFWLALRSDETNNSGVVEMYFNSDPEKLPALPTSPSKGYVVFYDNDESVLAIIECVSPWKEEEVVEPDNGEITDHLGNVCVEASSFFTDPDAAAAAGAKIYEVKSGVFYDQYKENNCTILLLEYTSVDTEVELTLPTQIGFWYVMPYMYNEYIVLNDETIYETSGILAKSVKNVRIRMTEEVYTNREEIETSTKDKPAGLKLTLHKTMMAQNPSVVIFCRLNLSE